MINEPDGFLGAVMAAQSIKGLKAMINGPGGCRSRTMNFLRETLLEYRGDDPCCCKSKYTGRVSMLPCTHLNADDIILGSGTKITDGLKSIISTTGSDVVLIDTLGASVQVVDREESAKKSGYPEKVVITDDDLSDMTMTEGFDDTMVRILRHYLARSEERLPMTVNILGYTQLDRSWDYGKEEISGLLGLLGIRVNAFIGCDCSPEELKESVHSICNIVIHPEYCLATARFLEECIGIPYVMPASGTPIGFDSIRSFIRDVASFFGVDPKKALETIDAKEKHLIMVLNNYDKLAGSLRGSSMVLEGLASDVLPMSSLLYDYFNVVPKRIHIASPNGNYGKAEIGAYLESIHQAGSLESPMPKSNVRIMFTDGYKAARYRELDPLVACIGIMTPFPDTVPLSNRCLIGISGTFNLIDQVLNGLPRFTCGQPTPADFR